jgi:hypothetical protein
MKKLDFVVVKEIGEELKEGLFTSRMKEFIQKDLVIQKKLIGRMKKTLSIIVR